MDRYEDKCETKYETKCETQYDSVCNDVQVPQVAATLSEWKRFQDFIFRTRHAQPSTKLNAKRFSDENLFHILVTWMMMMMLMLRCTRTSAV